MNKRTTFFIMAVILVLSLIAGIVIYYVIDKVGKNEKLSVTPKKQQKPDVENRNNKITSKKTINDVKSPRIENLANVTKKQLVEENKNRKKVSEKKKVKHKPKVDKQTNIKDIKNENSQEFDDEEHKRLWNLDLNTDQEEQKKALQREKEEKEKELLKRKNEEQKKTLQREREEKEKELLKRKKEKQKKPLQREEEENNPLKSEKEEAKTNRTELSTKVIDNREQTFVEEVRPEQPKSNERKRFRNESLNVQKDETWNSLEEEIENKPEIYKNKLIINRKGIRNQAANCYASSLFQCLNSLKCLREYLFGLNVKNMPFTKTVKQILYKLMEPGSTPISIISELNYIISSPIAKSDLRIGKIGDTLDLYDKIITSLIIESCNISFSEPIFSNRNFFNQLKNKRNFLIDNFLIHRTENYETSSFCEYSPYIRLVYDDNEINILEDPLKFFLKDYNVISSNNKIIVILLEFSIIQVNNLEVPRELKYGGKIYHLRSFCTNLPGSIGHYYATVRDKSNYIIFNDTNVEVRDEEVLKNNGLVRLIFYETE